MSVRRREFLKQAGAAGLMSMVPEAVRIGAWAAGSDAPEKKEIRIGFIPLTDCSSVVMASVMEFDKKYGIKITPSKEASWAAVRDKLVNGELDMAHVLYGLIYGVHLGTAGPKKDMAVLMSLNNNGQAITISNIQKTVADYYQLRLSDLLSMNRSRSLARPRQMAMALTKELTEHSLPEIGKAFGGRDHTTVMHACRTVRDLCAIDGKLRADWDKLQRALTG